MEQSSVPSALQFDLLPAIVRHGRLLRVLRVLLRVLQVLRVLLFVFVSFFILLTNKFQNIPFSQSLFWFYIFYGAFTFRPTRKFHFRLLRF
jgi:hypothetical protein